jgi:hypothetical protein
MTDTLTLIDWDRYSVSEDGDVIPLCGPKKGSPFKRMAHSGGYHQVQLKFKDGKLQKCYLHRVVAYHFLDNPDNLPEVNHIDGDKTNNHVSNLEWCTRKGNAQHALKNGLLSEKTFLPNGELNKKSKVKDSEVYAIRGMHRMGLTQKALAEHFCLDPSTVSNIVTGRTWAHLL